MKAIMIGVVLALAAAGTAAADCEYQGRNYATGSTICAAGGWLEECTVAGYWKAIGQCRAADPQKPAEYTVIPEDAASAEPPKAEDKAD